MLTGPRLGYENDPLTVPLNFQQNHVHKQDVGKDREGPCPWEQEGICERARAAAL